MSRYYYLNSVNSLIAKDIGFQTISSNIQLIEHSDILQILKLYDYNSYVHKYSKGTVDICAGSIHYPGAAILCSKAAKITGSGYVKLHIVKSLFDDTDRRDDCNDFTMPFRFVITDIDKFHESYILQLQNECSKAVSFAFKNASNIVIRKFKI